MALNSDRLCDALFDRLRFELQDVVKTFERRRLGGESYGSGRRPALELRIEDIPVAASQTTFPPVWLLHFIATVYVDTPKDEDPDKVLRAMVRRVEAALEKRDGERSPWWTTLGGVCDAAYLNGTVDFYEDVDGWSAVDVPIEVATSTKRPG